MTQTNWKTVCLIIVLVTNDYVTQIKEGIVHLFIRAVGRQQSRYDFMSVHNSAVTACPLRPGLLHFSKAMQPGLLSLTPPDPMLQAFQSQEKAWDIFMLS